MKGQWVCNRNALLSVLIVGILFARHALQPSRINRYKFEGQPLGGHLFSRGAQIGFATDKWGK